MTSPATVPSPQVRHLSAAPPVPVAVVVPVQPTVVARPVVVALPCRPHEDVHRMSLAEAQDALQRLSRTS